MTDKTETALDLDGLAASGFTQGPWEFGTLSDGRGVSRTAILIRIGMVYSLVKKAREYKPNQSKRKDG